MALPLHVIKVGGSLFDLADLASRLRRFLASLGHARVILYPGGGQGADAVRLFDRVHQLGEETSHWLALRALVVNAHFLARLLPEAPIVTFPDVSAAQWMILDPLAFAERDETQAGHCPHSWSVTSDSLALRVAQAMAADGCILLKSAPLPENVDWTEAAERGLVDRHFAAQLAAAPMEVRWINLREPGR